MNRTRLLIFGAIALLLVGGGVLGALFLGDTCGFGGFGSAEQGWELDTWIPEQRTHDNGSTEMTIEVILSGHATDTRITGLKLQLLDENESTIRTVDYRSISGHTRVNRTVVVDRLPTRIDVETEEIHSPENAEYWIAGVERTSSGRYKEDIQIERTC